MPDLGELFAGAGWPAWLAIGVAIAVGAVFQIGAGVGFGSITGPAAMLLVPHLMPATISCLALLSAALGSTRIEGRIAYGELCYSLLGRVFGAAAAGVMLAKLGSRDGFALVFAALTLLGVAMSLGRLRLPLNPATLVLAGGLSGLMATVTTIGGPPMALIYQNEAAEKARPTMNAFFGIGMIPSLAALWGAGVLGSADAMRAFLLLPAILAGVALARVVVPYIDRRYRSILLVFCILAALIIGVRATIRIIV